MRKEPRQSPFLPLFVNPADDIRPLIASAASLHALNEQLTSYIQEHTDAVCPDCRSVCCADRFGRHDRLDLFCLAALGLHLPSSDENRDGSSPCRFHGPRGCILSRSMRPHRCNWFFCTPLLDRLRTQTPNHRYREFIRLLENITAARTRLVMLIRKHIKSGGIFMGKDI